MGYIYSITHITDNKKYIGQTIDLSNRWYNHKNDLKQNKHHSSKLQRAWNKYEEDEFKFDIIEEIDDVLLNEREKYWIQYYNSYENGYNETRGGQECGHEALEKRVYCYNFDGEYLNLNFPSTRETSRQLQIDQTLVFNICNGTRNKKSATSKVDGKVYRFSYELKDKLPPVVYNKGQKKIVQLDLNDNIIREWDSIADANEAIYGNRKASGISKVLSRGSGTAGGYKWKYASVV